MEEDQVDWESDFADPDDVSYETIESLLKKERLKANSPFKKPRDVPRWDFFKPQVETPPPKYWVTYFIKYCDGSEVPIIKIGTTRRIVKRFRQLCSVSPCELELLALTEDPEEHIHRRFSSFHVGRNEFFRLEGDLKEHVDSLVEENRSGPLDVSLLSIKPKTSHLVEEAPSFPWFIEALGTLEVDLRLEMKKILETRRFYSNLRLQLRYRLIRWLEDGFINGTSFTLSRREIIYLRHCRRTVYYGA